MTQVDYDSHPQVVGGAMREIHVRNASFSVYFWQKCSEQNCGFSRSGDRLSWLQIFMIFLSPIQIMKFLQ
jgi:hypothetical protein